MNGTPLVVPPFLRLGPQATQESAKRRCADCACVLRSSNDTGRCVTCQNAADCKLGKTFLYADRADLEVSQAVQRRRRR
jgi:hypothetical protein